MGAGGKGERCNMKRILIGKNSTLWNNLSSDPSVVKRFDAVISHKDLAAHAFDPESEIWILSYSRQNQENQKLIDTIGLHHTGRVFYFSTAAANVCQITNCYQYPRVKYAAAAYAAAHLKSVTIVHLGFVYGDPEELPSGHTAAISREDLAQFFREGIRGQHDNVHLFKMVDKLHGSNIEKALHRLYDFLQKRCGRFPCALRPLDLIVRAFGWKWYGYANLSNRLWSLTTSL